MRCSERIQFSVERTSIDATSVKATVACGEALHLRERVGGQLVCDALAMSLDRAPCDQQATRDFVIRVTANQQLEHFTFALGQKREGPRWRGRQLGIDRIVRDAGW